MPPLLLGLLLAGAAGYFVDQAMRGGALKPLPDDERGAGIMTATIGELGLMTPALVRERQSNPGLAGQHVTRVEDALRKKGWSLNDEQRGTLAFILAGRL